MKGVKKIKWTGEGTVYHKWSIPGKLITIGPDEFVFLAIDEWYPDTTEVDKNRNVTWIWQTKERSNVLKQTTIPANKEYGINIPRKLCGAFTYYIQAALFGKPDSGPTGLLVRGYSTPRITDSQWKIANNKKNIAYGQSARLQVTTEGLNGLKISIEIYNKRPDGTEELMHTFREQVINGEVEVDLGVNHTLSWFGKIQQKRSNEEFYVKIKYDYSHNYLVDGDGNDIHARFLNIASIAKVDKSKVPDNISPLVIGKAERNYKKIEPCRYTKIQFTSTVTKIVFDEDNNQPVKKVFIPIIGSDFEDHRSQISFKLLNLDTTLCLLDEGSEGHRDLTFVMEEVPENFIIKSKSLNTLDIDTGFQYHQGSDAIIEKTSFKVLEYLWPQSLPNDNSRSLKLRTSTCRYTHSIEVLVYPDIKWTISFKFGMKGPKQFTHTNLPGDTRRDHTDDPSPRFGRAQKKAVKAGLINSFGIAKEEDGMELEFQLSLKAEYNKGQELEFAEKYADKIKLFLNKLLEVKEFFDKTAGLDEVSRGHKTLVRGLGKRMLRSPIVGSIDYPSISVAGSWQAAVNDKNLIYTSGQVRIGLNPFIKGDISLDIIAAATYIPVFGQVVKAIEIALNASRIELSFLLALFGQVNAEAEFDFSEESGADFAVSGEIGIKLTLSAKATINFNMVVFEVAGEIQAEGAVSISIKPTLLRGQDANGIYLRGKSTFPGINVVVIVTAASKTKSFQYKDVYNLRERSDLDTGKFYLLAK